MRRSAFLLVSLLGLWTLPFACSSATEDDDVGSAGSGGSGGTTADGGQDASLDGLVGNDTGLPDHNAPEGLPLNDATSEKPGLDGDLGDVTLETSVDAPAEVGVDAPLDVAPDVELDVALDVAPDVALDVGPDVAPDVAPDAPVGPVSPGVYAYTPLPAYNLLNPPAVAWHPSGTYALILDTQDEVWRLDEATSALTVAATAGTSTRWRDVVFTPDGSYAVLLAQDSSANEGRVFLWDHAAATLSEMTSERFAGGTYEELAYNAGGAATLLGAKHGTGYIAYVWDFDVVSGRSNVRATNSSAGCQGIDWATDAFDQPSQAIVCGVNGVDLMHIDGGGNFVKHTLNAGNTSRISSRPQGDYALAVCWSCNKIYRFERGIWDTDFYSPYMPGALQVEFSTDGMRALLLGGHGGSPVVGQIYEYRHDLYDAAQFMDESIPNFDQPPYNADTYVNFNDASWRPGCDEGIIVGGANSYSSQKAYVIRFVVENGKSCSE